MSDKNLIKIEDAYNPLGCPDFIDLTISFKGRTFKGLMKVLEVDEVSE